MKKIDVPFFKQDTTYTCGPVALQMVLAYHNIRSSEEELSKVLKTDPDRGTRRIHMREVAQSYGLNCYVNNNAAFEEFSFLLSLSVPVIILFLETDQNEDHYGVVIGADSERLVIHDPWNGPAIAFDKADFLPRWTSDTIENCERWLMAVSKESLPLGHQYT